MEKKYTHENSALSNNFTEIVKKVNKKHSNLNLCYKTSLA